MHRCTGETVDGPVELDSLSKPATQVGRKPDLEAHSLWTSNSDQ